MPFATHELRDRQTTFSRLLYAVPIVVIVIAVAVGLVVIIAAVARGNTETSVAIVAATAGYAIAVTWQVQVAKTAGPPSMSFAFALTASSSALYPAWAVWGILSVGVMIGILATYRANLLAAYGAGCVAIASAFYIGIISVGNSWGVVPVFSITVAVVVYFFVSQWWEYSHIRGLYVGLPSHLFSALNWRRSANFMIGAIVLSTVMVAVHGVVSSRALSVDSELLMSIAVLALGVVMLLLAYVNRLRNIRVQYRGVMLAALATPWDDSIPASERLVEFARETVNARTARIAQRPPRTGELGVPVDPDTPDGAYLVVSRSFNDFPFSGQDSRLLTALTRIGAESLRMSSHARTLKEAAYTDSLTGLPNYRAFQNALVTADEERSLNSAIAVLFIDVDKLKHTNDEYGHDTGDVLLTAVGSRLAASVGPLDFVARVGGDEFVVILREVASLADAKRVSEVISTAISAPLTVADRVLFPSASVGLAYSGQRESDLEKLVIDADKSMLRVKNSGSSQHDMKLLISPHRGAFVNDLIARSIAEDRVTVALQPMVSLRDNTIWGFEALARLHDEEYGHIPPTLLVDRAKGLGLMDELSKNVVRRAVEAAQAVRGVAPQITSISINLEAGQIMPRRLGAELFAAISENPELTIIAEMHERSMNHITDELVEQAMALHGAGLALALDDYGSQASSVSSLVRFPLDYLKIDRSLVTGITSDPGKQGLVRMLSGIGCDQQFHCIAEGVEDQITATMLTDLGVPSTQGYFFGRPEPLSATLERLRTTGLDAERPAD